MYNILQILSTIPSGTTFTAYRYFGKNPYAFKKLMDYSCFVNPDIERVYIHPKTGAMIYRKK